MCKRLGRCTQHLEVRVQIGRNTFGHHLRKKAGAMPAFLFQCGPGRRTGPGKAQSAKTWRMFMVLSPEQKSPTFETAARDEILCQSHCVDASWTVTALLHEALHLPVSHIAGTTRAPVPSPESWRTTRRHAGSLPVGRTKRSRGDDSGWGWTDRRWFEPEPKHRSLGQLCPMLPRDVRSQLPVPIGPVQSEARERPSETL